MIIMKNISNYNFISFDLFDTLVKRDVRTPIDVFKLVENNLLNKYANINYAHDRRAAEVDLYSKKKYEEISLEEIYDNFPKNYSKTMLNDYKNMELEVEYDVCGFNESIRDLYDFVKDKKIIIITDIYLPKNLIVRILEKSNIKYDYLFVSSDIRLKKKTGNLFKYVLETLNLKTSEILHIGDNKLSDHIIPESLGIDSYKIDTLINNSDYNSINKKNISLGYNVLSSFINNRCIRYKNRFEKIGYECLGPLLFGFSKWLYDNFDKKDYDKILFLSRDGQIMQKAFNIFNNRFKSVYFYASRRALIVPNLKDCNNVEEMFQNFSFPKYTCVNDIIKKFGLKIDNDIDRMIKNHKINGEEKFFFDNYNNLQNSVKELLNELYQLIVSNSYEEYKKEEKYLQKHIFKADKKISIVDIGWYGNMQLNLEKTLQNFGKHSVDGYYLGLVPKYSNRKKLNMKGFMFDTSDTDFETYIKEKNFNSLFELLFSADHGTVIKYKNEDTVEFAEYEYSKEQLKKIQKIQDGALDFISDFCETKYLKNINYSKEDITYNIFRLGNNPTYEDSKLFGDFLFLDSRISKISNYNGPYFLDIKKMYSDFKISQWKIAFLRLLFKVNMPYEKICRILRRNNIR